MVGRWEDKKEGRLEAEKMAWWEGGRWEGWKEGKLERDGLKEGKL